MLLEIIQSLSTNSPLISFLGGLIIGDSSSIGFAFLASQGIVPFWKTMFFCFLGMVSADILFYSIGRTTFFDHLVKSKHFHRLFRRVDKAVQHLTHKNTVKALFYTKFTFGTKILISMYLGDKKIPFFKFLYSAIASSFMWLVIATLGGYLAGGGFLWVLTIFKNLPIAFLALAIIFFTFLHFHKKAHDKIIKENSKHKKKKNAKLSHKKR